MLRFYSSQQTYRSVYILLTRSGTYFSRLLHKVTAENYTHVSICLDTDLQHFYSFGRKNELFMFPAGFVREDIRTFRRFSQMPCALYELQVPLSVYQEMQRRISQMLHKAHAYHYNCLGILLCKLEYAHQREYHYFCSQFVADLLQQSGALDFSKAASLVQPGDFLYLPQLQLLYEGQLDQLHRVIS
jgi:inositol transport system substrate-binding protein